MSTGRAVRACSLLLLALLLAANSGAAQERDRHPPLRRVPVTVVLLDTVPHDPTGAYVFQRRPGLAPQDVILLRTTATAAELADAVRLVLTTRALTGDVPDRERTLRARPRPVREKQRAIPAWVTRVLNDVHGAEAREVAGFGSVKAVEIWLPRQEERVVPFPARPRGGGTASLRH